VAAHGSLDDAGAGWTVSDRGRPLYRISVVAEMLGLHPQTLRLYEKKGLVRPSRTTGRTRLYSEEDVEEIRLIVRLARELGVNLAGIEIILKMRRQMRTMQDELEAVASHGRPESGRPVPDGVAAQGGGLVRVADRPLRKLDVW
jgi:MerR family transcriptional regulator/heat shock protein HspR